MFMRRYIVRWLLLLALPALACRGLQRIDGEGQAAVAQHLITYIGIDYNLYVIDPATGTKTAITDDAHPQDPADNSRQRYQSPTWSPDGSKLAFVGFNQVGRSATGTLYVVNPDGTEQATLFSSSETIPFYLYWAPDNEQLAFLAPHGTSGNLALWLAQLPAGDSRIIDTGQPYYWHWGPDGQQVINHVGGVGGRLSFLAVTGETEEARLALEPAAFQAPDWSPDGRHILLAATMEEDGDALILLDDQGDLVRILETVNSNIAFGWSPDGGRIAFINGILPQSSAVGDLSVIELDNLDELIFREDDFTLAFFWSPDGRKLAYFVLAESPFGPERQASLSKQARRIYLQLRILDLASGEIISPMVFEPTEEFLGVLPFFDQYQHSVQLWSADSRQLVVSAVSDSIATVWLVPADGSQPPQPLEHGLVAFWSWD